MVSIFPIGRACFAIWAVTLISVFALGSPASDSPLLAGPVGDDCLEGSKYSGKAAGTVVSIAGVQTYVAHPPRRDKHRDPKKVILFFSDVNGPFYVNNFLLQDHFATQGFHVLGLDYFFGDPVWKHADDPNFELEVWYEKVKKLADEATPRWTAAVRKQYGSNAKYFAVGYCFGAPYTFEGAATNNISAGAVAHPAKLTEDHFNNVKQPMLLSCAENDVSFEVPERRRAVDLLMAKKASYLLQVFSGVLHGFATRADPADANAVWAKEESARSIVGWFNRFA